MIRIGILGAAAIAPNALILPAASIVGIEIAAVAASSAEKANAFCRPAPDTAGHVELRTAD